MKPKSIIITLSAMLAAHAAFAQNTSPVPPDASPAATSLPAMPDTAAPATAPSAAIVPAPPVQPAASAPAVPAKMAPAIIVPPPKDSAAVPASTPANASDEPPTPKNEIRMNFQGTALTDVLNYLSTAAGFVIVQQTPVSGTVNIISHQPVTADEAVVLLDQVLSAKGYTVIRNGRILNIVATAGAITNSAMPVIKVNNPEGILPVDETVTDILQVKYVDATKLMENLRPLLAANASMTVNESSNSLLITDTKANIKRIATIVQALDTSVSSIATIKVYPLRYADAKDFANVLTQLFSPDTAANNAQQGGPAAFFRQFARGGGGGGGGEETPAAPTSEARKAQTRVVAVADTQSNSVVVSAPAEYIDTIDEIVQRLDTSTTDVTETRIFHLQNADSGAIATELTMLYGDPTTLSGTNRNAQNGRGGQQGGRGGNPFQQNNQQTQPSSRELMQARMVAVADPRTNSVVVNCSHDTMEEVALTIGRLDSTNARKQQVFTYTLQHADPDAVLGILRTLFFDPTATTGTSSALAQRQITGASSDITNTLGTNGTSNGGGGGQGRVP